MSTLAAIFAAAFAAATILPFYSEVAVGAAIAAGYPALAVWTAASTGNTLGAVVNGALGRVLTSSAVRRKLRIGEQAFERATERFNRYGAWSLLLAWLPVGGDALTVVGGAMRVPWWQFVTLVFIGKSARYAVLIAVLTQTLPTPD